MDSEAIARDERARRNRRRAEILHEFDERPPAKRDYFSFMEVVDELARRPGSRVVDQAERERMVERLRADFRRDALGVASLLADPDRPFSAADMVEAESLPLELGETEEDRRWRYVYPLILRREAVASNFRAYGIPWPAAWGAEPVTARLPQAESTSQASSKNKGGRPPRHDKAAFFAELAHRMADDPDGMPTTDEERTELKKDMEQWCVDEYGDGGPGDTTIKNWMNEFYERRASASRAGKN
jgi:hypothetical protein